MARQRDEKRISKRRLERQLKAPPRWARPVRVLALWVACLLVCGWVQGNSRAVNSLEGLCSAERMIMWSGRNNDTVKAAQGRLRMVTIDDAAFQDPYLGRFVGGPLPREVHARVIDELRLAGAKVVVYDILFDASRPGDKQLAQAARRFGKVVWGAMWDNDREVLVGPNAALLAASPYVGHARSPYGDDHPEIDSFEAVIHDRGNDVPAMSLQAARLALDAQDEPLKYSHGYWRCGKLLLPTDRKGRFRVTFFGDPDTGIPHISLDQVYNGALRSGFYRENNFFKDKIVIVGDMEMAQKDFYTTPIGRMSGMEAQAYGVATLLQQSFLRELSPFTLLLVTCILAALSGWLSLSRRWLPAFSLTIMLNAGFIVLAFWLFVFSNTAMPIVAPVMTALAVALISMVERGYTEERRHTRISAVLSQYVSAQVSEHGAPTGEVALLFTDLEGSTVLSRKFGERFERVRDEHFRIMRGAAHLWHGFEVETAGDSLYLVFRNAGDAVRFAVDAQRDLMNHEWPPVVGNVRVRMGIHYGQPFVGRDRARLTYRGPATNRAARVMGAALGGQILVSNEMRQAAGDTVPARISFQEAGVYTLKGLGEEMLYQVCHPDLPTQFGEA